MDPKLVSTYRPNRRIDPVFLPRPVRMEAKPGTIRGWIRDLLAGAFIFGLGYEAMMLLYVFAPW
jgi:hypothetical protein